MKILFCLFVLSTFHSFTKSAPYDLIFFLTYFCLKPCIKAVASPLQPVQKFALLKIVAVYISLLFLILLASIHLCCCFKYIHFICLYIISHLPFTVSFFCGPLQRKGLVSCSSDSFTLFQKLLQHSTVPYQSISQPSGIIYHHPYMKQWVKNFRNSGIDKNLRFNPFSLSEVILKIVCLCWK